MPLPALINPVTIQMVGTAISMLISTGKMVGREIAPFVKALFGKTHVALTEDQLDAIAKDVENRADVREALSLAEAGTSGGTLEGNATTD